jgi:hypothetical protein
LRVSEDQRLHLLARMECFRHIIDADFKMPSRHTLTRYITSYFQGFHLHLPFIHKQTWRLIDTPLEVFFAIATMGAQYCFEYRNSERLFRIGTAILLERINREISRFGPRTRGVLGLRNSHLPIQERPLQLANENSHLWEPVDTIKALIVFMGYATWYVSLACIGSRIISAVPHALRFSSLKYGCSICIIKWLRNNY